MYNKGRVCDDILGGAKVEKFSALKYLVWVSALSASIITPIIISTILAYYIKCKFNLGNMVIIVGLILGFATAAVNIVKFFKFVQKQSQKSKEEHDGRF